MFTGGANYSNVHPTDPTIAGGGTNSVAVSHVLNEAAVQNETVRQNCQNHPYLSSNNSKSTGSISNQPILTPPPSSSPHPHQQHLQQVKQQQQQQQQHTQTMNHGYRRVKTSYPQGPSAHQIDSQRRPSQSVAPAHIPVYWRSNAAAPLPSPQSTNSVNIPQYNQTTRQNYPIFSGGPNGHSPTSQQPPPATIAVPASQLAYKSNQLPQQTPFGVTSPPQHMYTGPRSASRGRAPLPRGFHVPSTDSFGAHAAQHDNGPTSADASNTSYHTPSLRQRSLSTDATASRMPYLRPLDGNRGRPNISDSSLAPLVERHPLPPLPPSTFSPSNLNITTANNTTADDEWPPGSFGHYPMPTSSASRQSGRKSQQQQQQQRPVTLTNFLPANVSVTTAFANWSHGSRNSTPSPSGSPSSSVVNSPVDGRSNTNRVNTSYSGSMGARSPNHSNVPPPRHSGPMATFGRIMSRNKQQQQHSSSNNNNNNNNNSNNTTTAVYIKATF
ncbi:hypothetical protein BDF19DRAFT_430045 [Syncephalis fuscata]|nr:hypothetical protein BDF19DRAFT_430045 [Syncephalis fuscata]